MTDEHSRRHHLMQLSKEELVDQIVTDDAVIQVQADTIDLYCEMYGDLAAFNKLIATPKSEYRKVDDA